MRRLAGLTGTNLELLRGWMGRNVLHVAVWVPFLAQKIPADASGVFFFGVIGVLEIMRLNYNYPCIVLYIMY